MKIHLIGSLSQHDAKYFAVTEKLGAGVMLATLGVVAFACMESSDSAVRVHTILDGIGDIFLVWIGACLAYAVDAVHVLLGAARESLDGRPTGVIVAA